MGALGTLPLVSFKIRIANPHFLRLSKIVHSLRYVILPITLQTSFPTNQGLLILIYYLERLEITA